MSDLPHQDEQSTKPVVPCPFLALSDITVCWHLTDAAKIQAIPKNPLIFKSSSAAAINICMRTM